MGCLYIFCWCNQGVHAIPKTKQKKKRVTKNISIFTSLLRECVVLTCCLPALSSTVFSNWGGQTSAVRGSALVYDCPRSISVHHSLFRVHTSGAKTSEWVLKLNLIDMFNAANRDESACLYVWHFNNFLPRVLCSTCFRRRIHLCNIFLD